MWKCKKTQKNTKNKKFFKNFLKKVKWLEVLKNQQKQDCQHLLDTYKNRKMKKTIAKRKQIY